LTLGVLVCVVGILILTSMPSPDVDDSGGFDAGAVPAPTYVPAPRPVPARPEAGAVPVEEGNSFCKAYVYKRCNELGVGPATCSDIALAGAEVPPVLGIAGCRETVDQMLQRLGPDGGGSAAVGEAGSLDASAVAPGPDAVAENEGEAPGTAPEQAEQARPAGPDPETVARGMERIRQLETEIAVARNTFVGTNIGIQARLDEMRSIAEQIGTEEARATYNSMLDKLGSVAAARGADSSEGSSSGRGASSSSGSAAASSPVSAAPVESAPVQAVPATAAPSSVIQAAPSSF